MARNPWQFDSADTRGMTSTRMNRQHILELLEKVQKGRVTPEQGCERLENLPFEDLGFARVDHHRTLRQGFPEVIFGLGKKPEQVAAIVRSLLPQKSNILVTRCHREVLTRGAPGDRKGAIPRSGPGGSASCRIDTIYGEGMIHVVCAGTSDIPVAEEAALTARLMGNEVETTFDVGVAGIHRLLSVRESSDPRPRHCCGGRDGGRAAERGRAAW